MPDIIREKAIRLFQYLRELIKLRYPTAYNLENYEDVLWLHEVPSRSGCSCTIWSCEPDEEPPEEILEVFRPNLQPSPQPPDSIARWLDQHQVMDSSRDFPELRESIFTNDVQGQQSTLDIRDHPDVRTTWEAYVEQDWWPWAEEARKLKPIQQVYTRLYSMYQQQQLVGGMYEVVLGIGCLCWKAPNNRAIRRHIITAQVELKFDADRGVMAVIPAAEGAKPRLEQDMLESQRPDADSELEVARRIGEAGNSLLGNDFIHSALRTWLNAFDVEASGRYESSTEPPEGLQREPVLRYAPAIILRKRTSAGLLKVYDEVVRALEQGDRVPPGVSAILVAEEPNPNEGDENPAGHDEPLLFPLPANEEQRRIAQRLSSSRTGVLVQGPPGTGKSHTIANLISHLLAQGKRVLVTSHGPQALTVLKNKLPPEVGELCVFLLGNDVAAKHSLEKSVSAITNHYDCRSQQEDNAAETARLEQKLDLACRDEAETIQRIISSREKETYRHVGLPGGYSGTALKIAEQLSRQAEAYDWFTDDIDVRTEAPVKDDEALELLMLLRRFGRPAETDLDILSVDITRLPAVGEFAAAIENECDSLERFKAQEIQTRHPAYPACARATSSDRESLNVALSRLHEARDTILSDPRQWVRQCTVEALSGSAVKWRTLLSSTKHELQSVQALLPDVNAEVSGLDGQELITVKADAEALLAHFNDGKGLGFWPIRPAVVRTKKYIIDRTHVNGKRCRDAETLKMLVRWLELRLATARIEQHWRGVAEVPQGHLRLQLATYEEWSSSLEHALRVHEIAEPARAALHALGTMWEPAWHLPEATEGLKSALAAAGAESDMAKAREWFESVKNSLRCKQAGPRESKLVLRLSECVNSRECAGYGEILAELQALHERTKLQHRCAELLSRLVAVAPVLAKTLEASSESETWETRLKHFQAAWDWTRVRAWLAGLHDLREYELLLKRLDDCRNEVLDIRKQLAVTRAWQACMSRLTEPERRHLRLWANEVRKITKSGRGKYDQSHRAAAQRHLEACRSAIPAWVMPIHRVADTVKPVRSGFDVAIIDEASQSGPECIFLQYIASQVVIVGDPEQISPHDVGIDRSEVSRLRERYVSDVETANAIGPDTSFFGLAEILYGNVVRLREHFRCMPEIIRFSNDLCYANSPLIPLRQHGTGRLDPPVKACWIKDGYQEGESNRTINPPEAEALVSQIEQCLADDAYAGKTMGVICLLGHGQSRYIDKLLKERVSASEIEKRLLLCGEPYAFQGDERDVIFLSMVSSVANNRRIGALTHDSYKRSFNVAVSRAKEQVWLFHSVTLNDLNPACMRYRLLHFCLDPTNPADTPLPFEIGLHELESEAQLAARDQRQPPRPFDSWFEVDVYLDLKHKGYRVLPQYKVAGYRIDFVVEGLDGRMAVECDGDRVHDEPDRFEKDLIRQRELERCGWTFWRIRGSDFYRDRAKAIRDLCERLERMDIVPLQREAALREKRRAVESTQTNTDTSVPYGSAKKRGGTELPCTIEQDNPQTTSGSTPVCSAPYLSWEVQDLPDPRTADKNAVENGLLSIINAEGPITDSRAYRLYAHGARLGRVARVVRRSLDTALGRLKRRGKVSIYFEELAPRKKERVIVPSDRQSVVVRALSSRKLDEVPLSELAAVIHALVAHGYGKEEAPLFRKVLDLSGRSALTHAATSRLRAARRLCPSDIQEDSDNDDLMPQRELDL